MKPSQNPFRSSALKNLRYHIAPDEISALLTKVKAYHYRACIKGPHGTGKSTLLEDIAVSLRNTGKDIHWHYINRQMNHIKKCAVLDSIINSEKKGINFLDGGEVLGFFSWNRLITICSTKKISLLATTHHPCLLPVLFKTKKDISLMLSLSQRLAADAWNDQLKQVAITAYHHHAGNMREVFGDCYLYCAKNE